MKIGTAGLAGLTCLAFALLMAVARAGTLAPSPSGDCIDLDSITADSGGRMYFTVSHPGKPSCPPTVSLEAVAVDCSQATTAVSHEAIRFYVYSDGSRGWESSEAAPDKALAATIVFACLANW